MSSNYFHADIPPQEFLDDLHAIDVPRLFDTKLNKQQRTNLIKLTRQRLTEWHKGLKDQIRETMARYTKEEAEEARLAMAAYRVLEDLGTQMIQTISNLERSMKSGRVLPKGFSFGSEIFGDYEWAEWHLGEHEDSLIWDDMVATKRRLDSLMRERKPLMQEMTLTRDRLKEATGDLKRLSKEYKRKRKPAYVRRRLFFMLLIVAGSLAGGIFLFQNSGMFIGELADQAVGGSLMVLGPAVVIIMVRFVRRHRVRVAELKSDLENTQRNLVDLKEESREQRLQYYPLNDLCKELSQQYKQSRKLFR